MSGRSEDFGAKSSGLTAVEVLTGLAAGDALSVLTFTSDCFSPPMTLKL